MTALFAPSSSTSAKKLFYLPRIRLVLESSRCPAHNPVQNRPFLVVFRAWAQAAPDGELILEAHLLLKPVEGTFGAGGGEIITVYARN